MASAITPVLFIDGKATALLQVQKAKKTGNTYWAHSSQAVRFGLKVDGSVLPNGRESVFSVGVNADASITIPLSVDPDARSKSRGSVDLEIKGEPHVCEVVVNDFADGTFNLKASVRSAKKGGASRPVNTAAEIFA